MKFENLQVPRFQGLKIWWFKVSTFGVLRVARFRKFESVEGLEL